LEKKWEDACTFRKSLFKGDQKLKFVFTDEEWKEKKSLLSNLFTHYGEGCPFANAKNINQVRKGV
jgi:F0F1-type ATP synthase delta subunit